MWVAEGSNLVSGDGGIIGVVVAAALGAVIAYLRVRQARRDSNASERADLLKNYRQNAADATARAEAAEREADRLRIEILDARGKQQSAELDKQRALDKIEDLTGEIGQLKAQISALQTTVEHKIPEPDHGSATDHQP